MRRPIIVTSRLVPKRFCVNLFGTIWTRDPSKIDCRLINHERIHTAQQRELLFIPFYIFYGIEWLFRLAQYRDWYKAYLNISFEREAYTNGDNTDYLSLRQHFSWLRYF